MTFVASPSTARSTFFGVLLLALSIVVIILDDSFSLVGFFGYVVSLENRDVDMMSFQFLCRNDVSCHRSNGNCKTIPQKTWFTLWIGKKALSNKRESGAIIFILVWQHEEFEQFVNC